MISEEELTNQEYGRIWQEYCSFPDLDLESYMKIRGRPLEKQIGLRCASPLGKKILKDRRPKNISELRSIMPLTTHEDYAGVLLLKKEDMLPDKPVIWIQTMQEGGKYPIKVTPCTSGMLKTYKDSILICPVIATSKGRGSSDIGIGGTLLYRLVPLPYITGLILLGLSDKLHIEFPPLAGEVVNMTFSKRGKRGLKMGLGKGIDSSFGMGSVAYYASMGIASSSGGSKKGGSFLGEMFTVPPSMTLRYLKAKEQCEEEERELMPKDLFKLKGSLCAGTDNHYYKDDLEELWGVGPVEVFAGTEPSFIGTETWNRSGFCFLPGARFYEFIPKTEMYKNLDDPSYVSGAICMNEVAAGEVYEIVLTVLKGGAFTWYRVGDVYRCLGLAGKEDEARIPKFEYIDRVLDIIDIAGFIRISENFIKNVVSLSGINAMDWAALKEFTEDKGRPCLHMHMELAPDCMVNRTISREFLKGHLTIYFKYVDQDYRDLKQIPGMGPLEITILRCDTFASYREKAGKTLRHVNLLVRDIQEMIEIQTTFDEHRRHQEKLIV